MIKGAIFDVDGTLLDSMCMWNHAAERYLIGLNISPEPNLEKKMFTFTMRDAAKYLKNTYNISYSENDIMAGINTVISNFYKHEAQPKDGVISLLEVLSKNNIPMAVATSTDRCHIEAALTRLDMMKYFKKIFTCTEVGVGKVKPDIYIQAAKYIGSDISETWVFEDAYHAARTAHDAGFKVCGVYDASEPEHLDELKSYSHIYVESFKNFDLSGILK